MEIHNLINHLCKNFIYHWTRSIMGLLAATVGILFVLSCTTEAAQADGKRKGRFFFVSTSTSTSTFSTTTQCYVKATSIVACTKERRELSLMVLMICQT